MKLIHHVGALALALVAVAVTLFFWERGCSPPPTSPPPSLTTGPGSSSAQVPAEAPSRVRTLTRANRDQLREQIRTAIAKRVLTVGHGSGPVAMAPNGSAAGAGSGTREIGLPQLTLEDAGPDLQAALQEAIPHLADCYGADKPDAGSKRAAAMMTMISDPELGTVIDTERVTDETGAPLTDPLETCLRDAIEALALPGLEKPGALPLQYTFVFD